MKKILATVILFTFLTSIQCAFAQPKQWAPVGATWHFNSYDTTGEWAVYRKIEVKGDTLIAGKLCRRIEGLAHFLPNSTGLLQQYIYTYDSNNVIFFYDFNTNLFTAYFDHKLNEGDTFYYKWAGKIDTLIVQSKIYSRMDGFNPQNKDSAFFWSFQSPRFNTFLENVGYLNSFTPFYNSIFVLDTTIKGIRCYQDSSVFYKFNPIDSCTIIYRLPTSFGKVNESSTEFIYAFPNPSRGTFELADGIDLLSLTDATGRTIPYVKQGNLITLSAPYQGLAILHVQHSQIKSFKSLKILLF
jgi:hypothetical protein